MKISRIHAFLLPRQPSPSMWMDAKPFLLIKIETDEGICGWGEVYTLAHRERAAMALVKAIGEFFIGADPLDIRAFVATSQTEIAERRPGIDFFCAQSGLEIALWDILGKSRDRPVRELLGTAERDTLMLYANCWSSEPKTPSQVIEKVAEATSDGFSAVKIYPFQMSLNIAGAAAATREVCSAIAGDVEVFLDCSRRMTVSSALEFVERLQDTRVAWFEEPVSSRYLAQLADINQQIALPVVTGESLCGTAEFEPVMNLGAAEILNPDVGACGGVLELKEIASLAQTYSVRVSPHNYNSMTVGLQATAQVSAVLPNFMIAEYFPDHHLAWPDLAHLDGYLEAGFFHLGRAPGLGVEINEELLASVAIETYVSERLQRIY